MADFDPNQPFEIEGESSFDPNAPFTVEDKPPRTKLPGITGGNVEVEGSGRQLIPDVVQTTPVFSGRGLPIIEKKEVVEGKPVDLSTKRRFRPDVVPARTVDVPTGAREFPTVKQGIPAQAAPGIASETGDERVREISKSAVSGLDALTQLASLIPGVNIPSIGEQILPEVEESRGGVQRFVEDIGFGAPLDAAIGGTVKTAVKPLAEFVKGLGGVSVKAARQAEKAGFPISTLDKSDKAVKQELKNLLKADEASKASGQAGVLPTRRPQGSVEKALEAVAPETPGAVPEKTNFGFKLSSVKSHDDAKRAIANASEKYKGSIDKRRRGVVTDEQTEFLADQLGMTPNDLRKRKAGQAFNVEQIRATREILAASAEDVHASAVRAVESGNKEALDSWFNNQFQSYLDVLGEAMGARAEAGRALRGFRGEVGSAAFRARTMERLIKMAGGRENLTQDLARRIASIDPTDTLAMHKFARDVAKIKRLDQLHALYINGLVSGPVTHIVNNTSNTLTALIRPLIEKPLAATSALIRSPFTKGRERFFGESIADLVGMWKGMKRGVSAAGRSFKTGAAEFGGTKLDPTASRFSGKLPRAVESPTRALVAEDEFFKAVNYTGDLYAQAYRNAAKEGLKGKARLKRMAELIQDPTEEMVRLAKEEAVYRTYQKELGTFAKRFQAVQKAPGMRYIIPFYKTPTNITKFGLERSPLKVVDIAQNVARGNYKGGKLDDEIAKFAMGSLLAGGVMTLAAEGKITGSGPRDSRARQTWLQTNQPYSVKIGDKWYQYNRLEPVGMTLGLIAEFRELFDLVEGEDMASAIALSIARNVSDKTYLQNVSRVVEAIDDPERWGQRFLGQFAGSFVPAVIGQTARAIDPTVRRVQSLGEGIKGRIPFLRSDLEPIFDLFGNEVVVDTAGPAMLSPVRAKEDLNNPAMNEVVRLKVQPGSPRKDLRGIKMTREAYMDYARLAGKLAEERITKRIAQPGYQRRSDFEKADILQKEFLRARRKARRKLNINKDAREARKLKNKIERAESQGVGAAELERRLQEIESQGRIELK